MLKTHNINEDLEFERTEFALMDKFYRNHGGTNICRHDFNTAKGKILQKKRYRLIC